MDAKSSIYFNDKNANLVKLLDVDGQMKEVSKVVFNGKEAFDRVVWVVKSGKINPHFEPFVSQMSYREIDAKGNYESIAPEYNRETGSLIYFPSTYYDNPSGYDMDSQLLTIFSLSTLDDEYFNFGFREEQYALLVRCKIEELESVMGSNTVNFNKIGVINTRFSTWPDEEGNVDSGGYHIAHYPDSTSPSGIGNYIVKSDKYIIPDFNYNLTFLEITFKQIVGKGGYIKSKVDLYDVCFIPYSLYNKEEGIAYIDGLNK